MQDKHPLIGQTLGQYQITEQIGLGGMSTVFQAHQPALKRDVALKILSPALAAQPDFLARFSREATAIGNLHHPNILPIYDSGVDGGYSYLAMRYIPLATTLADLMKEPLPQAKIIEIISQIAAALDHAHQNGIIHRDVKPSNILMDKQWVLLSDFGMAKLTEDTLTLTGTGVGMGTPAYMSPEQGLGERVDHRADIYALGVILFEMLTGQIPHQGDTPIATVMKRINEPLPKPREIDPEMPEAVEAVLLKALAHDRVDRFESAGALAEALKAAYQPQPAAAPSAATVDQPLPQRPASSAPTELVKDKPAKPQARSKLEIGALALFGVTTLCGALLALGDMLPGAGGDFSYTLGFTGLGQIATGLISMAMIWFRQRARSASALLAASIVSWFVGANLFSFGVFAAIGPSNDQTFLSNLATTAVLCFAPGGILAALGLFLYRLDYQRGQTGATDAANLVAANKPAILNRAEKQRRAARYLKDITKLIKDEQGAGFAGRQTALIDTLKEWEDHIEVLIKRLDRFESNPIIQRDLTEVPQTVSNFQKRSAAEQDPYIRDQLSETLARHQAHQRQLQTLTNVMRRTELEIDETLATIGTIYSQLQLMSAKEIDSDRANRISDNIEEEAHRLNDLLLAMDEAYEEGV